MIRASVLLLIGASMLIGGCVQSLHPFYTESQLTYDESLIGKWTDPEGKESVTFTGDAEAKVYHVVHTDSDGKTGKFDVRLAKVQDHLLADITPQEMARDDQSDLHKAHLLPVHSFLLLERKPGDADALSIREMDYDWFKEYLSKNPTAIAHENLGDDRIILTAAPEKVQAFVLEHLDTAGAYEDAKPLKRVAPAPATPAAAEAKP